MNRLLTAALLLLVPLVTISAQTFAEVDPLFRSHDILELRITAPLTTLMQDRPDEEELPATVSWQNEAGATVTAAAKVRTRGNYRRQRDVCPFAPIRLNFKKSDVKGTLFDKQDKLKLVTHCKNGSSIYEEGVLREYLAYRIFNQLTDMSFQVRLLRITYENNESSRAPREEYGFFIESEKRLGKRSGRPPFDISYTSVENLEPAYTNLVSMFQYFVGNTDYSPIAGAEGESCCHNATLFGEQGTLLLPVPYDFDMGGMVDTQYATPNPKFKIRSVQTRVYRGRCQFNDQIPASIARFNEERDAIYELIETSPGLEKRSRGKVRKYTDLFYKTINDPAEVKMQLTSDCVP
ncbi:MAG TPA: hypothetical protein PKK10_13105 [Woeseiaceae bacterium]|nr:hypothetical protein [Woeseiaceae bacterium]